jgi:hypothetical protein
MFSLDLFSSLSDLSFFLSDGGDSRRSRRTRLSKQYAFATLRRRDDEEIGRKRRTRFGVTGGSGGRVLGGLAEVADTF